MQDGVEGNYNRRRQGRQVVVRRDGGNSFPHGGASPGTRKPSQRRPVMRVTL